MQTIGSTRKTSKLLYALLHAAAEDLELAKFYGRHLLKKGWHFTPWERGRNTYLQQSAYATAFAVSYSRPFTQARGQLTFPARLLSSYGPEQRRLHKQILDLRNKLYAHSDVEMRKAEPFSIEGQHATIEFVPEMKFSREELLMAVEMIEVSLGRVRTRLEELFEELESEA